VTEIADRLESARQAYQRRDWATAYDVLSELRRQHRLSGADLAVLSDSAWWLGLIRETLEVCEECHERYLAEGQAERAALTALETGFNWFLRGEPDIGSGWLSRARRILADLPEGLGHGWLLYMEAVAALDAGDYDNALAHGRRLQALGADTDEPVLSCFGLALEGTVAIRRGQPERGFALLDEAMLPVLAGRIDPGASGNLYCHMMSLCHDLADVSRARRWTEVTQRWCDTFSSAVMFVGICRVHRTQLLRLAGEWERAVREASAATIELSELNVEAVAAAYYEIGETHRLRGDMAAARAAYDQAVARGHIGQPGVALLLLAEGRDAEADTTIRRCLAEETELFRRARLLAAQVEIACARGDVMTAEAAATELAQVAETYPSEGFLAWAALATGVVLVERGQPAQALDPLRSALSRSEVMGARYDAATARAVLGRALSAMGDHQSAALELAAAREAYALLGAVPRLAELNTTATVSLPGGLTPREAEILAAIAEGLSNREVAGRLVISEKTVARHLANIFTKLDVSSRTAAAAWAYQHGLARDRSAS
jgi:DNA-binding NarL/FixJ family response regulator